MTNKQIIFKCDVDCIKKNTEECFELDCIKGQESILKQLQAKEQECEELKKIIDEAKNSKLDLKSFLVGEAIQNEYEQQLDQLEMVNDSLKSELMQTNCYLDADKETIDQLKADNEELKKQVDDLLHKPEIQDKILWKIDNEKLLLSKDTYIYKLEKTLAEIKELLLKTSTDSQKHCVNAKSVILQKIREVIPDER